MNDATGGSLLVRGLQAAGITTAFGIHGAHIDAIFQAALDEGFEIVDTRHEVSAGHAAEGLARVTGQLGVAFVTAGGGLTNVVTSLANAWLDRTPLLVITGSGPLRDDESNTLQAGIDQVAVAAPVTKWAHRVVDTTHIPRLLAQAIRIATTAPRGPVLLDIPWDILGGTASDNVYTPLHVTSPREAVADAGDMAQALERISSAKRPVIIAGGEVTRGAGAEALAAFCNATGLPALADFEGLTALAALPDTHHAGLVQGLFGLGSDAPDLVVMAGLRFGLNTAHGSGILIPRRAQVIQIDPDPREFGRLQQITMGLNGGVSATLQAMADATTGPDRHATWRARLSAHVTTRHDRLADECADEDGRLHPFTASHIVAGVAKDRIVVADGALTYLWLSETISAARPRNFLCHGYLGSMGVGFGTALGAAHAAQAADTQALLVTGDGAVGYALAEFDTAVRYNLPLVVVVMNNRGWGATQHFKRLAVGANRVTKTLLPNGEYHAVAAAFGAASFEVHDADGLRAALDAALAAGRPACINVHVALDPIPPEEKILMGGMPFDQTEETAP